MPTLVESKMKAAIVVGVTAVVASSAAAVLAYRRSRSKKPLADRKGSSVDATVSSVSARGTNIISPGATNGEIESEVVSLCWADEVEKAQCGQSHTLVQSDDEVNHMFSNEVSALLQPTSGTAESPSGMSVHSDTHSEASVDSGKGCSVAMGSILTPFEELEVPPLYDFEVPQDVVGLLIGKQGANIKWLMQHSGAHIVIRKHYTSDRHKICTLEGSKEEINTCLKLIRRRFPLSHFPELKLTPLPPAPHSLTSTPIWESLVQLTLPDGVKFEASVSSCVDAGHIFIQQPTHPTYPSLARMDQYMMTVYGQGSAGAPELPRPIESGLICAAPMAGGWYRAQTVSVFDDTDDVMVKFVDYGGYARLPAQDLRQIRSDFMSLPFQAAECYLAGVKPVAEGTDADGWSADACQLFEQLVLGKLLETKVVGVADDGVPLITLSMCYEGASEPLDIGQCLIDGGFAESIKTEQQESLCT